MLDPTRSDTDPVGGKPATEMSSDSFNVLHQAARRALNEKCYGEAEALFTEICTVYPQEPIGFVGRAELAQLHNDWALALKLWDECLEHFPEGSRANWLRAKAWALAQLDRNAEAEEILQTLVDTVPNDNRPLLALASIAMRQQKWDAALQRWDSLMECFPSKKEISWAIGRADALRHLGKLEEAQKAFREIIREQPDHVYAGIQYLELLGRNDPPDEALAEIQHGLLKGQQHYELILVGAQLALRTGDMPHIRQVLPRLIFEASNADHCDQMFHLISASFEGRERLSAWLNLEERMQLLEKDRTRSDLVGINVVTMRLKMALRDYSDFLSLTSLAGQETRKIVIVLGMHRSGTSLTSSVLSSLGVDMSDDIEVMISNARGHWERRELVRFHDRVLQLFERDWYDSRHAFDLPSEWWTQPQVRDIRDEMIAWLTTRLQQVRLFGFKDPRTARMLPMWDEICAKLNLDPCYVYCVRNPNQVAASLIARDGIEIRDTEYRWMVYNSHVVLGVRNRSTCIISYEDWFSESGKNITKLMSHLGIVWPFENLPLEGFLADIADPHLQHHKESVGGNTGRLPSDVLYRHIIASTELGYFNCEALDSAASFAAFENFVQPVLASVSVNGSTSAKASPALPVRGSGTDSYSTMQVSLIDGLVTTLHLYAKALREILDEFVPTVHHDRDQGQKAGSVESD